jgi:glycerol-3-phosphate dehydrogenase
VDFFNRRTGAILFNIHLVKKWRERVIAYMDDRLNWSEQEREKYLKELDHALKATIVPVDEQEEILVP